MKALEIDLYELEQTILEKFGFETKSKNASSIYYVENNGRFGRRKLTRISTHLPVMSNLTSFDRLEGIEEISFVFIDQKFFQNDFDKIEKEFDYLNIASYFQVIETEEDLKYIF